MLKNKKDVKNFVKLSDGMLKEFSLYATNMDQHYKNLDNRDLDPVAYDLYCVLSIKLKKIVDDYRRNK